MAELRGALHQQLSSTEQAAFAQQQLTTSIFIGIASLTLAGIVAWLLTKLFTAPIQRIASSVSLLSNGDYSIRLNGNNKDELGYLMEDINRLAYKLEENRKSRKTWLANISHELRTPVTVLTGEIETLKDGIRPLNMQQVLSFDQEVSRLRHLINDLYELSLSDIGGLSYSFSAININHCLSDIVRAITPRATRKLIAVQFNESPHNTVINGDQKRLCQLFNNIIENSIAYTDSPGKVTIAITSTENKLVITIQDTAPSVELSLCGRLFEPLYRQEASRNRRSAGAGLGLSICKNIVLAHQGDITAYPSDLGGICIEIKFPLLKD